MYLRAFIDACEGFGWTGGPEFKTLIVPMANGRERRNADWSQGRHRFSLPFNNIDAASYRSIRQMFEVCRGMAGQFLYHDPLDPAANEETIGFGDGVNDLFQLNKVATVDGVSYQRIVYALGDDDAIAITIDGTPTSAYTLDRDRGTLVFDVAPADGAEVQWTGPYAIWVRFNNDWLPFSIDNRMGGDYARNGSVDLIEVAAPPEVTT